MELNGRYFGGNVVSGTYFDETRFGNADLAPNPTEIQTMTSRQMT